MFVRVKVGTAGFLKLSHEFFRTAISFFGINDEIGYILGFIKVFDANVRLAHGFCSHGFLVGILTVNDRSQTPNLVRMNSVPDLGNPRACRVNDLYVL